MPYAKNKGFTLIELLVVISIFVILTTIILSTLIVVLRGSKNSDSLILVKQNGNYAMTQMIRMIRFAKSLDSPVTCDSTPLNSITITTFDLNQTTFSCPVDSLPTPNFIASNSANSTKLTNMQTVGVSTCSFVCTQSSTGPPLIKITFSLKKINSNGLPEGDVTIPFQSSVTMRNLGSQ
jgi:prepilin-type N-terminal cleavage/methylation domain-containing protein